MLAWQAARYLAILADEQRLSIVATLAQAGSRGLDVEQLADRLVCDSTDLTVPLSKLITSEFVELEPNSTRYSANAELVEQLTTFLNRRLQPQRESDVRVVALAGAKPRRGRRSVAQSAKATAIESAVAGKNTPATLKPLPQSLSKRLQRVAEAAAEPPRPFMPPAHIQTVLRREHETKAAADAARRTLANRSIALIGLAEEMAASETVDANGPDSREPIAVLGPEHDQEPFFMMERVIGPARSGNSTLSFQVPKTSAGVTLRFEQTASSPYALQRPVVVVQLPALVREKSPVAVPAEHMHGRNRRPLKLTEALAAANFERQA